MKIYLQRYNFRLEKPSIQGFFTPYLEKTYYICDMQTTLFPDYFALDETCCLHRAEIVMEKLAEIPLDFLATHGERNTVLRRLAEAGVQSLAELLRLQRFDVVEWEGVGRFFLHIFDEMRQEIRNHPEQLIEQWLLQRATWVFPIPYTSDDPWSLHHYVSPSLSPEVSLVDGENQEWTPLIQQVEHTFTHIILLLKHRQPEKAAVLHRFLLQGLSAEVIARVLNLPSRSAVMRPIEHEFLRPLLAGKEVAGIKLSEDFCDSLSALRQQLLFQPTTVLDGLQFMSMPRFLWLLHLTPMLRTQAEMSWACDFIVPRGEVLQSRALLHRVFRALQLHPDYQQVSSFESLRNSSTEEASLASLLEHHPWIEHSSQGHRLMAEQLIYDFCRVGRILLESHRPLTRDEILMRYEQVYLERPLSLSMHDLCKRFSGITAPQRGQWAWISDEQSPQMGECPTHSPSPTQEPTLFDMNAIW